MDAGLHPLRSGGGPRPGETTFPVPLAQLRLQPERRYRWLWWYYRWRQIHFVILTILYVYALLGLHWATFVRREMGLTLDWILLDEFFILLPFLLGLPPSWDSFYRVEQTLAATLDHPIGRRFWRRADYLAFQVRQHLGLVLLPLTLFLGLQETASWLFGRTSWCKPCRKSHLPGHRRHGPGCDALAVNEDLPHLLAARWALAATG